MREPGSVGEVASHVLLCRACAALEADARSLATAMRPRLTPMGTYVGARAHFCAVIRTLADMAAMILIIVFMVYLLMIMIYVLFFVVFDYHVYLDSSLQHFSGSGLHYIPPMFWPSYRAAAAAAVAAAAAATTSSTGSFF